MALDKAIVLWFTGLSGSGKTTISIALKKLLEENNKNVKILDGDVVRKKIHNNLGFSRKNIKKNNKVIAELAKNNLNNFDFILVPIISPYRQDRIMAKNIIGKYYFKELFIDAPIEECKRRDPKGLYKKAINGEIDNFIGLSTRNPYENPDLVVNTKQNNLQLCVSHILQYLDSIDSN